MSESAWLIETTILVDAARGRENAKAWVASIAALTRHVSAITVAELLAGCRNRSEERRVDRELATYQVLNDGRPDHSDGSGALPAFSTQPRSGLSGLHHRLDSVVPRAQIGHPQRQVLRAVSRAAAGKAVSVIAQTRRPSPEKPLRRPLNASRVFLCPLTQRDHEES